MKSDNMSFSFYWHLFLKQVIEIEIFTVTAHTADTVRWEPFERNCFITHRDKPPPRAANPQLIYTKKYSKATETAAAAATKLTAVTAA